MNDHEKYLFDLRGYIVVKNALTTGQVEDLSARLEVRRKAKGRRLGSDRTIFGAEAGPAWSAPSLLEWGGTYIDLIDLPPSRRISRRCSGPATGWTTTTSTSSTPSIRASSICTLAVRGRADRATWSG